jgi:hypothetical protein
MAEIATYKCSNNLCGFLVRLSRDFPLWHNDTPRHLRSLSVAPQAHEYIVGTRSEVLCHNCQKVADQMSTGYCTHCKSEDVHQEQLGRICPRCGVGVFSMPKLSVY